MNQKIDFYIFKNKPLLEALHQLCILIENLYQQQQLIFILTDDNKMAENINQLLWTYKEDTFLPHHIYEQNEDDIPPILIGNEKTPLSHKEILINLANNAPVCYQEFKRVIEVVLPSYEEQARARFRFYKSKGCEMITHALT